MVRKPEWCNHIFWSVDIKQWFYKNSKRCTTLVWDSEDKCKICGKPRPKEGK